MALFDFLIEPLVDENKTLTRDLRTLIQDLQKARPVALPQLIAEAQAALADEQALAAQARMLMEDLSLFPPADQPGLSSELERILADGQALADTLQAFIHDPPSDHALLRQLAVVLGREDQAVIQDARAFVADVLDTRIPDPQQTLVAVVDLLAQRIETFAQSPPPDPDRGFLRMVDGFEHAIDVLVHVVLNDGANSTGPHFEIDDHDFEVDDPSPIGSATEPDRGLDRAIDSLADTIGALVHNPPSDRSTGAVLDTLARTMDALAHIGDLPPGPCQSLAVGIDTAVGAIDTLIAELPPSPVRGLDRMVDSLAHTIDMLVQGLAAELPPGPCRTLDGALHTLAQTIDSLVSPPPDPDRGLNHALDALAHTIDRLVDVTPPPDPERGLVRSVDALTHAIDVYFPHFQVVDPGTFQDQTPNSISDLSFGIGALAHTIDAAAHAAAGLPAEAQDLVAAIDADVRMIDALLHDGPTSDVNLGRAIESLAGAVDTLVGNPDFHVAVGNPDLDLALGTLAHTVDFLGHELPPDPSTMSLVAGADTLTHTLDTLLPPPPCHVIGGLLV